MHSCKVLICHESLIQEVREAYQEGDLVELLRHTAKDDDHPDDESTPLTSEGIEQAIGLDTSILQVRETTGS